MNIQIGKNTTPGYTFIPGTRYITLLGFDGELSSSFIQLITCVTGINNGNKSFDLFSPVLAQAVSGGINQIPYAQPLLSPIAGTPTAGGSVNTGTHDWVYTFVYANGNESIKSLPSNTITIGATDKTVPITISTGNDQVIARKIYRRIAGMTGNYLLVTTINDNTTTVFNDTVADASLGTEIPPEVSNAYDIYYSALLPALHANDVLYIKIGVDREYAIDKDLDVMKVLVTNQAELSPPTPELTIISRSNLAVNANPYWDQLIPSDWRQHILRLVFSCNTTSTTFRIFGTLNPDATVPADNTASPSLDWIDITEAVFGDDENYDYVNKRVAVPINPGSYNQNYTISVDPSGRPCKWQGYLIGQTINNATNACIGDFSKY